MPDISIKHIVSCSSEDKNHPAINVLSADNPNKKWKCATAGEKQASIIVQFDKASKISSIDIGNECSAFIEVLVGRSLDTSEKFSVLLVASAFMSPDETRRSQNTQRVRMFGSGNINKDVAAQRWDRAKIVCTQPFSRNMQFGLSFVRFHTSEEADDGDAPQKGSAQKTIGKFTVRMDEDDDESSDILAGSLFASRKDRASADPPPGSGAEIKGAAGGYLNKVARNEPIVQRTLKPEKDTARNGASSDAIGNDPKLQDRKRSRSPPKDAPPPKQRADEAGRVGKTAASVTLATKPKAPAAKKSEKKVPFDELFSGVVFVLSGFQNPHRAKLRDMACDMGATYKSDWGKDCTHLICAFANTPKYNQVKGKGAIVKEAWILDSYKQRRRLSWRKYSFEKNSDASSDEELVADDDSPSTTSNKKKDSPQKDNRGKETISKNAEPLKDDNSSKKGGGNVDDDDIYNLPTDDEEEQGGDYEADDSGDTDDEIERLKEKAAKERQLQDQSKNEKKQEDNRLSPTSNATASSSKAKVSSPSKGSGSPSKRSKLQVGPDGLPLLPCFFEGMKFLLFGDDFTSRERRDLKRHIVAYDGELVEYMDDRVTHVVTRGPWDANFDEALKENDKLIFVKPEWILETGARGEAVDMNNYLLSQTR